MLGSLRNRLTIRLIAMFTAVLLFLAVALSVGSAMLFSRAMDEQVYRAREDTLTQMEKNVTTVTNQINSLFQMYEMNLPLQNTLRYPVTPQSYEAFNLATNLQTRAFEFAMTAIRYGFDIALYGVNGILISNDKIYFDTDFDALVAEPWYGELTGKASYAVWLPGSVGEFEVNNKNTFFTVARLLTNPYNNMDYGVVMMRFRESSIYDIFEGQNASEQICLVNQDGAILSSNRREGVGGGFPVEALHLASGAGFERRVLDGVTYMAACRSIPRTSLTLYVLTPESEINRYSSQVFPMVAAIAVVCVLFSVVLAAMFSRSLTKPLVNLIRRIRLRRGPSAGPFHRHDDLTLLTTEYGVLLDQVERAVAQLQEEQEQKRIMEFQMLQYQINPHFLYNTLSSIKALVWTDRTDMIVPVTDALISLLESTLSKYDEMVSVEESLRFVEDYLVIQRIRLSRDIPLAVLCDDPALLRVPIPRLLLQPIVENSVFHGLEPTGRGGCITIHISRQGGDMIIAIEDDGEGISPETVRRIFEEQGEDPGAKRQFSRIGVRNVRVRIGLYYGGRGGMEIGPTPGGGTRVVVTIPLD